MSKRQKASLVGLGETELEILQHVWRLGDAVVADVHACIQNTRPVAYTTVMTVMKNLAGKGYLAAERDGTRIRYRPARSASNVKGSVARTLVDKVFGGSPVELVQALAQHESLSNDEIAHLRAFIGTLDSPSKTEDGDAG